MIGIAFVSVMLFAPALAINALNKAEMPASPDIPPATAYFGPSRRVFEIASALA